jgi:hypothetical protein
MRSHFTDSAVLLAAIFFSACAAEEIPAPPPPVMAVTEKQDSPERLERTGTVQITAVVTDIDAEKRLVTLKDSEGEEETIEVGAEVRNLAQVKRGDQVIVTYHESIVFQLFKPGAAKPGVGVATVGGRAEPGEKPGAAGAEAITITATVMAVDKTKPSITLKKPDGEVVTLPVRDASKLDPVRVGDLLEITYKRAIAVAVEKP